MRSNALVKWALCCAALIFMLPAISCAAIFDDSPPCLKEFETNFFPYDILSEALSMARIGQSQWTPIYNTLQDRSRKIETQVREKARSMQPNPFENPFNPVEAEKILMDVLYAEFENIMRNDYNVYNPLLIRSIFEYVRSRQSRRLKACLESHRPGLQLKPAFKY